MRQKIVNGPGDPSMCSDTVKSIQYVMEHYPTKPIFGICLGNINCWRLQVVLQPLKCVMEIVV